MKPQKVHFFGIGGSGMSACAVLSKAYGFEVSGCDKKSDTPYLSNVVKNGIKFSVGHNPSHVKDVDFVVATPAAFFSHPLENELLDGKKNHELLTWQKFMGEMLMEDKEVVSVSGTHGKSTTTAMLSLVFEKAGLDPTVMIGAGVPLWDANFRKGKSKVFIAESDEFFDNFLNYHPEVIVLNNIEMDHPDYFKNKDQLIESFNKHLHSLNGKKILIVNKDSQTAYNLAKKIPGANLISYSIVDKSADVYGKITKKTKDFTEFVVTSKKLNIDGSFKLKILGDYNVSNALGVISLSTVYSIKLSVIKNVLENFEGIGRRLELLGKNNGILVYDDYAHHPTAIKATLGALKQKYPKARIWAIVEPHSFSRTKALLAGYKNAFEDADKVIIAPIYKARDTSDFGVSQSSIVKVSNHKDIQAINTFDEIVSCVDEKVKKGDVILVMGAGESYKLSRRILESLK